MLAGMMQRPDPSASAVVVIALQVYRLVALDLAQPERGKWRHGADPRRCPAPDSGDS
jgi:hypothetical protein